MDYELPKINEEKKKELTKIKTEYLRMRSQDDLRLRGELEGFKRGLALLESEEKILKEKARNIPELYKKEHKQKVKEIEKVKKLIDDKNQALRELRNKARELEKVTYNQKLSELYIPYLLDLLNIFWQLQRKSFDENTEKYEPTLSEIAALLNEPPVNYYLKLAMRPDPKMKHCLTIENTR